MRDLSFEPHAIAIGSSHARQVAIADPLLPAAEHLVAKDASPLLGTAVAACGGALLRSEAVQVQHRPGHDLVVRYDAVVSWGGDAPRRETLVAAATLTGAPEGTLVLTAEGLEAGVWRYPFDPVLPGLAAAVSPGHVHRILASRLGVKPTLVVVAYRPMRRAVVRATGDGHDAYLKVVRPERAAGIAARHEVLLDAGLPVPRVLEVDEEQGLLVLEALHGENLRDRLLGSTDAWPAVTDYIELLQPLASITLPPSTEPADTPLTACQIAESHAQALRSILPNEGARLDRIVAAVHSLPQDDVVGATVHGDFYEAQLMVDSDGHLSGLLDLDDVGVGGRLEDAATLLAHLHILRPATRRHATHLRRYRERLHEAIVGAFSTGGDATELDLRTAGVLIGLATGPFRAQREQWRREVRRRLAMADHLAASAGTSRGEKTLRQASSGRHARMG